MIEMKYDEEKNNLKLPKNIRQVGKPGEKMKIYVEDYVITYINQIARESTDQQRLAVLLGRLGKNQEDTIAFIDGAVEAKNVTVQDDQVIFTSVIWTQIYDEIGQYFHNTEVVGWFLTRPGKSLGINEKITKMHVDNFPGVDKALLIIDPLDHDEAFYIYDQGKLVRQEGYYIYYERNEDKQNYMVDHKTSESSESGENNIFLRKREEIFGRRQSQKEKDSGKNSLLSKIGTLGHKNAGETDQGAGETKASSGTKDTAGTKDEKTSSSDLFRGMKRASSLVATFAILFALIFGFTQLNRNQTTPVNSTADEGTIPVDVAQGELETAESLGQSSDLGVNSGADGTDNSAVADNGIVTDNNAAADNGTVTDNNAVADNSAEADSGAAADGSGAVDVIEDGAAVTGEDGTSLDLADGENTDDDVEDVSVADASGESEVAVQNVIRQYEVQVGDTLAGITEKFYNDYSYIEMIQEMNQIEDPDMIYPGMMLNLPD